MTTLAAGRVIVPMPARPTLCFLTNCSAWASVSIRVFASIRKTGCSGGVRDWIRDIPKVGHEVGGHSIVPVIEQDVHCTFVCGELRELSGKLEGQLEKCRLVSDRNRRFQERNMPVSDWGLLDACQGDTGRTAARASPLLYRPLDFGDRGGQIATDLDSANRTVRS